MPTITVNRDELFKRLGHVYCNTFFWIDKKAFFDLFDFFTAEDEFNNLCFDFGIELDEVVNIIAGKFNSIFINFIFRLRKNKSKQKNLELVKKFPI